MNRLGLGIQRISLLSVALLLAVTVGCAPVQTKATSGQAETTPVSKGEREIRQGITREYLQGMLMGFADTFASNYATAIALLLEQVSSRQRVVAARSRFLMDISATDIASGPYPGIGLADMVVLVTLNRMVWEDYWQPEVFGDPALAVVETLRKSEEDIWALAATVMTAEQLNELHVIISEWREENPGPQAVSFLRFQDILELVGEDSLLRKESKPGGLFGPVTEAVRAVDEIRFTTERALYRLSRMQVVLGAQIEMVYHDLATQREVVQLLSNVTGLRETVEQLPAQISQERENIMRDLGSQEKTIRNMLGDIRQTMREGNDLISMVNETTKSVDTVSTRIDSMLRMPASGRPFDIMDYYNTVLKLSDTVAQANSLVASMEGLLVSPNWEQTMPGMFKLANGLASEGKGVITHAFLLGIALMLIFFVGMFILIRYGSRQFAAVRKG